MNAAERNSRLINMQKEDFAQQNALIRQSPGEVTFAGIKNIEYIGKQDVYNMEVVKHHNFSINGGLIVHNCQDANRYLVMGMWHKIKMFLPFTERE